MYIYSYTCPLIENWFAFLARNNQLFNQAYLIPAKSRRKCFFRNNFTIHLVHNLHFYSYLDIHFSTIRGVGIKVNINLTSCESQSHKGHITSKLKSKTILV